MQVTFQTNSPELRKELEHGWEQFSADAASGSALSLSEPRFEASGTSPALPNAQADTSSFSPGQQNSRRQETPTVFEGEPAPSGATRRAGFASTATLPSTAGQPAAGRWSGWA